jgi:hypothetical protein
VILEVLAMSTQSDEQRQPASASMSARHIGLVHMRNAADAAELLRQRATDFLTKAMIEPSPIDASALRKAGATVNAIAVAMDRQGRDDTAAAAALMHLARDYRETHQADPRDPDFEDYQIVCGHLADTLAEVGTQLRQAAAAELTRAARGQRHPHVIQRNL